DLYAEGGSRYLEGQVIDFYSFLAYSPVLMFNFRFGAPHYAITGVSLTTILYGFYSIYQIIVFLGAAYYFRKNKTVIYSLVLLFTVSLVYGMFVRNFGSGLRWRMPVELATIMTIYIGYLYKHIKLRKE